MENDKMVKALPPQNLASCRFLRVMSLLLCVLFALVLVGCDSASDYDDFVEQQKRYEQEKELVGLLREYNAVYQSYTGPKQFLKEYVDIKIEFIIEDTTLFTSDNFLSVSLSSDILTVKLDDAAADTWAQFSSENIGATISIAERKNDNITILSQPIIGSAFFNGLVPITGGEHLFQKFSAILSNKQLTKVATAYNEKLGLYRITADYFPSSLAIPPSYLDVTSFLEKAELKGF